MNTPDTYIPRCPDQFIGPARKLAAVLERKAGLQRQSGNPAKILLVGTPGCGKTRLAEFFAHALNSEPFYVESVNGRNVTAELVREWQQRCRYVSRQFSVKIINEMDTVPATAQDLLLSYLDELPAWNAVVCTSNLDLASITPRFQTRFQQFTVKPPAASEIAPLLESFGINGHSVALAERCKGNVRAALLDAQSILDMA